MQDMTLSSGGSSVRGGAPGARAGDPAIKGLWSAFDRMPIGIMLTDAACTIEAINTSASAAFRVPPERAVGRKISDFLPIFFGIADAASAEDVLREAGDHMEGLREDGSSIPCEVALSGIDMDADISLIWTIRDVTARTEIENQKKLLEKELQQAHQMESLGTLAGGIAHELNTPIQFVSNNMRFLGDAFEELSSALEAYRQISTPADNEKIAAQNDLTFLREEVPSAVKQSLEGLARAADIVLAIKRFSHPTGDIKESNDLNQIVETTVTVSKNQWKYLADLELDLDPKLPPVKSNAGELNQVLINLIVNAAHAIEDKGDKTHKGKIVISTRRVGNAVACSVSDSGVGIPAKIRDKIFDLFFTTKVPGRGTGQGLALVHKIITNHGGRMTVDSEVGRGSRFIFVLPLEGEASARPPDGSDARPSGQP